MTASQRISEAHAREVGSGGGEPDASAHVTIPMPADSQQVQAASGASPGTMEALGRGVHEAHVDAQAAEAQQANAGDANGTNGAEEAGARGA